MPDPLTRGLRRYDPAALDAHAGAIYAVTADLRLAYFNTQWFRFAAENDGEPAISEDWTTGRSVLDCMSAQLAASFRWSAARCLETRTPWVHEYDCSSPTEQRRFHQIVYALDESAGLLIVNSPIVERADDEVVAAAARPPDPDYTDGDGLLHQCMHCRRFRRPGAGDHWDWIPRWAAHSPPQTSHGLCTTCFFFHYPVRR